MTYVVELLRQEHRNIEKLLHILERELSLFDRGDRPNYELVVAIIDYFKDCPDTCPPSEGRHDLRQAKIA